MAAADVQKLRESTGAGMMDCKRALDEAGGDFDKAIAILNEKGIAKALKKADRATGAGLLESYIHNGRVGVLMDLRCETDFVVRSEPFRELAHNILMHIAAMSPATVEELLQQPYVKDPNLTIDSLIKGAIAKIGENIQIAKFCRYEL